MPFPDDPSYMGRCPETSGRVIDPEGDRGVAVAEAGSDDMDGDARQEQSRGVDVA